MTWNVQNSGTSDAALEALASQWDELIEWDAAIIQELGPTAAFTTKELGRGRVVYIQPLNGADSLAIFCTSDGSGRLTSTLRDNEPWLWMSSRISVACRSLAFILPRLAGDGKAVHTMIVLGTQIWIACNIWWPAGLGGWSWLGTSTPALACGGRGIERAAAGDETPEATGFGCGSAQLV